MECLCHLLHIPSSAIFGSVEEYPVLADFFQGDIGGILGSRPSEELFEGAVIIGEGAWSAVKLDLEVFEVARDEFLEGSLHIVIVQYVPGVG
jgi:hypothetical protein